MAQTKTARMIYAGRFAFLLDIHDSFDTGGAIV